MKPFLALLGCVALFGSVLRAQTAAPHTTNFAPLDYFNDKCARCHGAYGAFYGETFAGNKDDAALAQVVQEMCEGPAQAPLSPSELEVLVAWHRALRDRKPFVAAVKMNEGVLSGEATPGSSVVLQTATGEQCSVPLDGHKWSVGLPQGVQIARIRVSQGGQSVELDPRSAAFAPK